MWVVFFNFFKKIIWVVVRKVQMLKMWREGHRRSPRISALGAWKDQAPRPPVKQKRRCGSRTSASASASPSVSVSVYIDQQKEHHPEGPASRTRAKKKRKLKPLQDVASSTPSSYKVLALISPFLSSSSSYFILFGIFLLGMDKLGSSLLFCFIDIIMCMHDLFALLVFTIIGLVMLSLPFIWDLGC